MVRFCRHGVDIGDEKASVPLGGGHLNKSQKGRLKQMGFLLEIGGTSDIQI